MLNPRGGYLSAFCKGCSNVVWGYRVCKCECDPCKKEEYDHPGQARPTNRETTRQEATKAAKDAAAEEAAAEYQFSDEYQAAAEAEEKATKIKDAEAKQEAAEAAEEAAAEYQFSDEYQAAAEAEEKAAHQSSATPGPSNLCSTGGSNSDDFNPITEVMLNSDLFVEAHSGVPKTSRLQEG